MAQVRRNKGAPGLDGMTVDDLAPHLRDHRPDGPIRLRSSRRQGAGGARDQDPTAVSNDIRNAALRSFVCTIQGREAWEAVRGTITGG